MKEQSFNAKVDGQDRVITIDASPSWGKLQELLKSLVVVDNRGVQRTDMNAFFNKILDLVIINGLDEIKDPVKRLAFDGDEMTYILGEILKIIPLQKYSKNLGMDESGMLSVLQ